MLKILENKEKLQEKVNREVPNMIVKIVTKDTDNISVEIQVNKEGPNMIVKIVTKDRQNQCGNTSKQRRS